MPLEFGLWRIDGDLAAVELSSLDLESRLEDILDRDIWPAVGLPQLAVRTRIDRANLRAVLKGRRKPSPAMLVRLQAECDRCSRDA